MLTVVIKPFIGKGEAGRSRCVITRHWECVERFTYCILTGRMDQVALSCPSNNLATRRIEPSFLAHTHMVLSISMTVHCSAKVSLQGKFFLITASLTPRPDNRDTSHTWHLAAYCYLWEVALTRTQRVGGTFFAGTCHVDRDTHSIQELYSLNSDGCWVLNV
jgi:hypothetical protein